jgi:hypothetical protein
MANAVAEKLTAQYRAHPQWSYQLESAEFLSGRQG